MLDPPITHRREGHGARELPEAWRRPSGENLPASQRDNFLPCLVRNRVSPLRPIDPWSYGIRRDLGDSNRFSAPSPTLFPSDERRSITRRCFACSLALLLPPVMTPWTSTQKADMRRIARITSTTSRPDPGRMRSRRGPHRRRCDLRRPFGNLLQGYFARPKQRVRGVADVIVIHSWWGLNDNIRPMTRLLAGEGIMPWRLPLRGAHANAPTRDDLMNAAMSEPPAARRPEARRAGCKSRYEEARRDRPVLRAAVARQPLLMPSISTARDYSGHRRPSRSWRRQQPARTVLREDRASRRLRPRLESALKKQGRRRDQTTRRLMPRTPRRQLPPDAARDAWQRTTPSSPDPRSTSSPNQKERNHSPPP